MTATCPFARGWDALGILLLCAGFSALPRQFGAPIDVYDEGLLLTHVDHILHGAVPYRDFYANYPPGVFLLTATTWLVTGASVVATRVLGVLIQVAIAGLVGRAAARAGESGQRLSWLATGATFLWLRHGSLWPTAWLTGLLFALIAVEIASRAGSSKLGWWISGACFGAVACLRHDLFVYASVLAIACGAAARLWRVAVPYPPRGAGLCFVAGSALPIVAIGGWVLWKAGYRQPFLDLYHDQVHSMLPGRVLPLPPLFRLERLTLGVWLGWIAPLVGLFLIVRGRRSTASVALLVLALAGLPQMMNRADMHHVVYGLAPGIGLLAIGVESGLVHIRPVWARVAVTLPCLLLLAGGALGLRWKFGRGWTSYPTARVGTVVAETAALAEARVQVLAFIARYSAPDERIFVGCEQHERVFISEMDLYFLSDRRGAVRRMQFDPNLTNREDEQRLMIAQIESMGTRVVVLAPFLDPHEPNDSAKSGSSAFDRYLDQHFELRERAGPYRLLLRRP